MADGHGKHHYIVEVDHPPVIIKVRKEPAGNFGGRTWRVSCWPGLGPDPTAWRRDPTTFGCEAIPSRWVDQLAGRRNLEILFEQFVTEVTEQGY